MIGNLLGPLILFVIAVLLIRKAAGFAFKMIGLIMLLVAVGAVAGGGLSTGRAGISGSPGGDGTSGPLRVRVLGDSYSAGNGAGDYDKPATCRRSHRNYGEVYANLVAKHGPSPLLTTNACSGAVTKDFTTSQHRGVPPQLDDISGHEDVILLTIGGNDLYFADLVQYCLVAKTRVGNHCLANLNRALSLLHDGTIERRLTGVLDGIGRRASRAKIVLVGYPYLEGDPSFTLTDRKEGKTSVAGSTCRARSGTTNVVKVGHCLTSISDIGEEVQKQVVRQLNQTNNTDRFVFVSTKALFAGSQAGFRGPNHELFASHVNSHRWFIQPFVDAQSGGQGTAEALRYGTEVFYHPNATGWAAEGRLLYADSHVPK